VVIIITLTLAYLGDYKDKYSGSKIIVQYMKRQWIAVRTLQAAMVLDLLSLMGAYAAGTCWDTFTTVYSSVLVGVVFFYLVGQVAVASCFTDTGSGGVPGGQVEERQPVVAGGNPHHSGSGGGAPEKEKERQKPKKRLRRALMAALASVPGNNKVEQDKANDRFRKVLMLLATFAVSITYLAGLSTPGGFWDSVGAGHRPGDAILKDHHNTRLAIFFGFNTTAFVASLLIIVVLLDTKLREINAYGFIVVALVSLIGAYNAGSCRQTDTTVYVFSLIAAVLLCISILYFVADHIHAKWKEMKFFFR
jgi:hypothetical protein